MLLALAQVSAHPEYHRDNIVGSICNGPGLLQIIALDCYSPDEQQLAALPRLSLAIRHQGALAWDMKWCRHQDPPFAGKASRSALTNLNRPIPQSPNLNLTRLALQDYWQDALPQALWGLSFPASLRYQLRHRCTCQGATCLTGCTTG